MSKQLLFLVLLCTAVFQADAQIKLNQEIALQLSRAPLHCIPAEFPNKTSHLADAPADARLLPSELHPVFYGCLDWHSSVHGHWMLVRLLQVYPDLPNKDSIAGVLDNSFQLEKMQLEAQYFGKYTAAQNYERTYGWAWLLKLDEELATWDHPKAKIWHRNLKPLTDKILGSWKTFLPKQTYPNRTGVHPNTAFAMVFALDWARATGDKDFENQLIEKAKYFYLHNTKTPAYLEPDGSDFFSPSLEIADLMRRVLPQKEFVVWLNNFYEKRSLENIEKIPVVSDLSDYQTVHLVGLSFTRAWCMKGIAKSLPANHPLKSEFEKTAVRFLNNGLPLLFQGNYGGDHWLASFAVYALEN